MFSIFPCVCWLSVCLLWRNVFLCLLIYLFILNCKSCLYIFWRFILFTLLHLQIFSPSLRFVFSSYDFLGYAKVLFVYLFVCLIGSICLFLFSSVWEVDQKWSCWGLCQRVSVCLCFPLKRFIVSGLTFMSLIHYESVFVFGIRKCSNSILLPVAVQFSQCHVLKRLSFLHCIVLPPLL